MKLSDLEKYNPIIIQCHDNPDADALGAGYGLYCYFTSRGREVRLVYSGRHRITKPNLCLMVEKLEIPVEYVTADKNEAVDGLLITVDCQYGQGNVTCLAAENVAVIDHHPIEIVEGDNVRIQPNVGSCSTLVWGMLEEENFPVNDYPDLATALYYGLYTDTNQFAELFNPVDMDMRESLDYNKSMLSMFRNSNLSLQELEIAGIAMLRYDYNDDYRFAVIKSKPCDPNILGLISDFLLQVHEIDTCAVFNETGDGFKFSVRSCIKEVRANELAAYLAEGVGSGGGHVEKAGGFISERLYEEKHPTLHPEAYFNNRMTEYFDSFDIIYAGEAQLDMRGMEAYRRRKLPLCYIKASEFLKPGEHVSIRNREGDMDCLIEEDTYFTLEQDGRVRYLNGEYFARYLEATQTPVPHWYCQDMEYAPSIKNWADGTTCPLTDYAKVGIPKDAFRIYARKITRSVKVFAKWDDESYMLGKPGDYLVVSSDDLQNVFIEPGDDFLDKFERMESL